MGFFKNLFKLKFGVIAKNAVKNIKSGQLIKGGGFFGNIINGATSSFIKPATDFLNTYTPPKGALVKPSAPVGIISKEQQANIAKNNAILNVSDALSTGKLTKQEAQNHITNILEEKPKSSILIYIISGMIFYYLIKKR